MPRRPLLPFAVSGPGRSTACASTTRRETGASTCAILRAVAGQRGDRAVDLVEQGADLRAIIGIPVGQHRGDDPPGVGVRGDVEHLPGPAPLGAVLLGQPLTRATQL